MAEEVVVYAHPNDPASKQLLGYLDSRHVEYKLKDVVNDPSASAELVGKLGKVVFPVTKIGDKLLVGNDPLQLSRFLPHEDDGERVSFGAAVRTVNRDNFAGLPAPFGVEVGEVKDGSPAGVAGIRSGDVITHIGAYTLTGGAEQFRVAIGARKPGDTIQVTAWRDGMSRVLEVLFPESVTEPAS